MKIKECHSTLQKANDMIEKVYWDIDKTNTKLPEPITAYTEDEIEVDLVDVLGDIF